MTSRHKILYLNHAAYIGGAEIALINLLSYPDAARFVPVVCAPEGELLDALRKLQIRCIAIPAFDGLNRYTLPDFIKTLPHLRSLILREAPALIHANTNFASEYSGILSKITKIPAVGHIRDIEPFGRMGRRLVRQNARVIAISTAVKQFLLHENVSQQQIVQIYDGVDLRQYQPSSNTNTQGERIIIGIIGQIGERKGHVYLLKAVQKLVQRYPQLVCRIVGKEPEHSNSQYTTQLHAYIRDAQLEPYVEFWGFRADIPEILSQLDILVLPSLQEPFGKIVIEAMAKQRSVVASKVGGVPEIVEDGITGLLVPPCDVESLSQALELLIINSKQRQQMGLEGRKRVEQMFSLEINVRETEKVYETILAAR